MLSKIMMMIIKSIIDLYYKNYFYGVYIGSFVFLRLEVWSDHRDHKWILKGWFWMWRCSAHHALEWSSWKKDRSLVEKPSNWTNSSGVEAEYNLILVIHYSLGVSCNYSLFIITFSLLHWQAMLFIISDFPNLNIHYSASTPKNQIQLPGTHQFYHLKPETTSLVLWELLISPPRSFATSQFAC